jgi:hypothetical protein
VKSEVQWLIELFLALLGLSTLPGYARHVDKLMWLKSIVRDLNNNSITREAQVRSREASCGSSVDQTGEPMYKNTVGGTEDGRAGPGSQSPSGQIRCVNGAVVSGKCINLSGEVSVTGVPEFQSAHDQASSSVSDGGV